MTLPSRLLWHSNAPWSPSGYGSQTALFTPLLRDLGIDVAISAFWGLAGAGRYWDDIPVFPNDGGYGDDILPVYATHHGEGDPTSVLTVTLMDVWVLINPALRMLPMASWVPVDHDPVPVNVKKFFLATDSIPVAMSRFGERLLQAEGLDPLYVPHGVDTERMRPYSKAEARAARGIPEDAFVVGMVAANQGKFPPRKAFPEAFDAFSRFRKNHPDALLYLHTFPTADPGPGHRNGLELPELLAALDVPMTATWWTPEIALRLGVPYEEMAAIYSCFDVLLNPAYGEGFGIPILEAQACGVPVIVNDFSAMSELCGAGWKTSGEPYFDWHHGGGPSYFQAPHVHSIVESLEAAYDQAEGLRDQAREFAAGYDTSTVLDSHWVPALEQIEARVAGKRDEIRAALAAHMQAKQVEQMPGAALNRKQRRRAARAA